MKQGRCVKAENEFGRDDRKDSQGYVNIKSQTTEQLKELIERQNKLLCNRYFLEKLPDKGKKILSFKTELEVQLKKKQEEYDAICKLLFNLNITGKNAEEIEWNKGGFSNSEGFMDSDDDDDDDDGDDNFSSVYGAKNREVMIDPLKYVATHSGNASGKKIKINSCESKLSIIDLKVKKVPYTDKYCEKYEKTNESSCKERFKPNRLRNNDKNLFKISAENVKKKLGNNWEVTQATPPAPVYKDAVMISLTESLKLQKEQAEKLKEIEKKNATEKLLRNVSVRIGDKLPIRDITEYRNSKSDFVKRTENNEENEFNDSDCEDEEECFIENYDVN